MPGLQDRSPAEVRRQVDMQSFASAASQQVMHPPGGQQPQPMEVGQVKGWKGKRGKGNHKGKHPPLKGT